MRTGWPVAIAMIAVVGGFAATLLFSQLELRPISDEVVSILGDEAPGIEQLSKIQSELMHLGAQADRSNDHHGTEVDVDATRKRIDASIAEYRTLPTFPGEDEHLNRIIGDLALLDEARDAMRRRGEQMAGTGSPERDRFRSQLAHTDEDVAALRTVDSEYLRQRATTIAGARRSAIRVVGVLGAASVVIAVLATILVIRSLGSRARLAEERDRLLAARATELEAFAGRVAHDLKNPLAVIAMRTMLAQEQPDLGPAAAEHLRKLGQQTDRTHRIIDSLLEFARAGGAPESGAKADLRAVLDDVLTEVLPAAENVPAQVEVSAFSPIGLECAPEALARVLSNLLGNAVKYVADGKQLPHRIAIKVEVRDGAGHVEIEDNGPGVPSGTEQTIFEPFRRLDTVRPGIGLGLATVKKIIEAYHGRVGVRSTPGQGSSFWFELPKAV
jgi:signal transduction histidine kinase